MVAKKRTHRGSLRLPKFDSAMARIRASHAERARKAAENERLEEEKRKARIKRDKQIAAEYRARAEKREQAKRSREASIQRRALSHLTGQKLSRRKSVKIGSKRYKLF